MDKNANQYMCTKVFRGFPCTHRQWRAKSHCKFVHGYDRTIKIVFKCIELTPEGWVMDFGDLKDIRKYLEAMFDHTFLIALDDPELETFKALDDKNVIDLRVMPNPGIEGSCYFVYETMSKILKGQTNGRVYIHSVEIKENEKNSAIYYGPSNPFTE